jgi:hypothetical protein
LRHALHRRALQTRQQRVDCSHNHLATCEHNRDVYIIQNERRRPYRVVYGASHRAGQLGENGPLHPSE